MSCGNFLSEGITVTALMYLQVIYSASVPAIKLLCALGLLWLDKTLDAQMKEVLPRKAVPVWCIS